MALDLVEFHGSRLDRKNQVVVPGNGGFVEDLDIELADDAPGQDQVQFVERFRRSLQLVLSLSVESGLPGPRGAEVRLGGTGQAWVQNAKQLLGLRVGIEPEQRLVVAGTGQPSDLSCPILGPLDSVSAVQHGCIIGRLGSNVDKGPKTPSRTERCAGSIRAPVPRHGALRLRRISHSRREKNMSGTKAWRMVVTLAAATALLATTVPAGAEPGHDHATIRFATYNASLNRGVQGQLISDLTTPDNVQAKNVAEVIQRTRPDVLLINEFDYDSAGEAVELFHSNYLSVGQMGADPISYPYRMAFPSNTGILSGFDLDNDGTTATPGDVGSFPYANDSWGFGFFPGQFAFAVYSMYPIVTDDIRTFQGFLWKDMPGALLPIDPSTGESFYSDEILDHFRLSSKNHVDVPIQLGKKTIHFLISHPTPPVFDGPEDRNGTRNHDEIRFWSDYVGAGKSQGAYIYDDNGQRGGLQPGSLFVIAGDLNADPLDGDSIAGAAQLLLDHPLVSAKTVPSSQGGVDRAAAQPGNETHLGDPANDTADFSEPPFGPGNLRVDYVLPSKALRVIDSGVFWPADGDELSRLTGTGIFGDPVPTSDHRLVWVDVSHGTLR